MKLKCLTMVARKRPTEEIINVIAGRVSRSEMLGGTSKVKVTSSSMILDEFRTGTRLVQALMPGQDQELVMGLIGIYA